VPGMTAGLSANNPTIVDSFKSTLLHQGLIALVILAGIGILWQALVLYRLRRAAGGPDGGGGSPDASLLTVSFGPEAPARRLLRVAFGCIWILDGLLQAQPDMPLGMTTGVMRPAAATSPAWVQHLVNWAATTWTFHPIAAPASAVWIQIGIGLWLLVTPRGTWSRLAGGAAIGWGLIVWVFAEAFGGIFAPGATWLFGTPGAVLFYVFAGLLVALPERWWANPRLGRAILAVLGLFLVGMAILQAWPGRGFWQGHTPHGTGPGPVATMAQTMAGSRQPHFLSSWLMAFSSFDEAHGFAVNLFIVVALGAIGIALIAGRTRFLRSAVVAYWVISLATWVLVQDLGFLGGVGTDPNSMIPAALVVTAGYVAVTRAPTYDEAESPVATLSSMRRPRERLATWWRSAGQNPALLLRSLVALGAVGIVALGAAPMAFASMNSTADPILFQATNGTASATNYVSKNFHLEDQYGRPVSLSSLRGKTVALTFLDPVCTNDCPIIGQDFRLADGLIGGTLRRHVELVAVVANPLYRARSYVVAYDRQEGMRSLHNWLYLTGSLRALESAWNTFGIQVEYEPGGAMIGHSEVAYVLDREGHVRSVLEDDPGTATEAQNSSFAATLASVIKSVASS
jgi:cytochrome oxidase Cu insertion factor (SCO1/SenC/PrrC family)